MTIRLTASILVLREKCGCDGEIVSISEGLTRVGEVDFTLHEGTCTERSERSHHVCYSGVRHPSHGTGDSSTRTGPWTGLPQRTCISPAALQPSDRCQSQSISQDTRQQRVMKCPAPTDFKSCLGCSHEGLPVSYSSVVHSS